MTQNTFRRALGLILTLCLILTSLVAFAEDEGGLPDFDYDSFEQETDDGEQGDLLPGFEEDIVVMLPLPNPGAFLGEVKTEPDATDYSYNGRVYDLYYYRQSLMWNNQLDAFLAEAEARGYGVTAQMISGYVTYVISDGTKQAMLFLNYRDKEQFMFMLEQGFEMDEVQKQEYTLTMGDVLITINGAEYLFSGASVKKSSVIDTFWAITKSGSYGFYSVHRTETKILAIEFEIDEGTFLIGVPENCKTATIYNIAHGDTTNNALRLELFGHSYYNGHEVRANPNSKYGTSGLGADDAYTFFKNEITGDKDYLSVFISRRDSNRLEGVFEGSFNGGADIIRVEFMVPFA